MRISDHLSTDLVLPAVTATHRDEVFRLLAARLAAQDGAIDAQRLLGALCEREQQVSTALADGVAIPHARLDGVDRVVLALARSLDGIDCGSHDGKPTHLFLLLVVPASNPGSHLRLLAAASRLLHDPRCRTRLMQAPDEASLLDALRGEEARAFGPARAA